MDNKSSPKPSKPKKPEDVSQIPQIVFSPTINVTQANAQTNNNQNNNTQNVDGVATRPQTKNVVWDIVPVIISFLLKHYKPVLGGAIVIGGLSIAIRYAPDESNKVNNSSTIKQVTEPNTATASNLPPGPPDSSYIIPDHASPIADDIPTPVEYFPQVDEIKDLPDKETVAHSPKVEPENVELFYMNATGIPMKLILFNCFYYHFPSKNDKVLNPTAERPWPFPANNQHQSYHEFSKPDTGWYVFFVLRLDNGKRYQLETKNVFYSDKPTIKVINSNDIDGPYKAVFGSLDQDNADSYN